MSTATGFNSLGLSPQTLEGITKKGFEEPTQIQSRIIPLFLTTDDDIVGQAQTGTGKTAAFGLPLIERLQEKAGHIQALILTPTRELAIQVAEEINSLRGRKYLHIVPIYGGQSIEVQFSKLRRGVDIVVGTPGRVIDHINRKTIDFSKITHIILDEADEMLNMGFIDDVIEIMKSTNKNKRTLLFSATMPRQILQLAEKFMGKYKLVEIESKQLTVDLTDQIYFEVNESDRLEALCRIIDVETEFYGLIFCRTKIDADVVASKLRDRGYDAEGLHGDIAQKQRERILNDFKKKQTTILVATDVAARGIDVADLSHVVNYSLPQDPESYVHRIGRTGRAGKQGTAITFITPSEYRRLAFIKRFVGTDIRKEKLPKVEDIINAKKATIKNDMVESIAAKNYAEYLQMSIELLDGNDAESVVAALLKRSFDDQLNQAKYREIGDNSSPNAEGKTRLFVAFGRQDGATPLNLIDEIKETVEIDSRAIQDIRIFDTFSFMTVPFEEAELILDAFREKAQGRKPLVERAKERTGAPHGRSDNGGRRSFGDNRGQRGGYGHRR
jgi:ATP-dependent RNA helicase DeaD